MPCLSPTQQRARDPAALNCRLVTRQLGVQVDILHRLNIDKSKFGRNEYNDLYHWAARYSMLEKLVAEGNDRCVHRALPVSLVVCSPALCLQCLMQNSCAAGAGVWCLGMCLTCMSQCSV